MPVLTLQPDAAAGKDAKLVLQTPITPAPSTTTFVIRSGDPWANRAILEFDVSSIPATATILTAVMTLEWTNTSAAIDTSFYAVTEAWTEAAVCWNYRVGTTSWTTVGGTKEAGAQDTVSCGAAGSYDFDVSDAVARWVAGTLTNNGLLGINAAGYDQYVATSDHGTAAIRPKLVVTYTVPGGGLTLVGVG